MSSASERRFWMGRAKIACGVVVLVAVLVGALHFLPKIEKGQELLTKAGESLPIATIDIETDGTLELSFLLERIAVEQDANLLTIDLDELKRELESIGQVKEAVVTRRFPDALEVSVFERSPIARLLTLRKSGERQLLFVDEEGVVFDADELDARVAKRIPFLDGIELNVSEGRFSQVSDIEPLANLLAEAKAIAPHLYSRWQVVSLERDDCLIAKGKYEKRVIFDRKTDFRNQLGKLDYILDYYRGKGLRGIDSIDLTLDDQVPVRML